MPPRSEEKGKGKAHRTRFIVEEIPDSSMFISMLLSSQVPRSHMQTTQPHVHSTPPHMHSTSPISGSFTGLLSTPDFSSFPPIYAPTFISPPGYTPIMHPNTPHPTYFSMSSMPYIDADGSSMPYMPYMEAGGSSMPHSSPMHYTHDEQDDEDDTSAHDHEDTSSHDHGYTSAPDSAHEEGRRTCILRNALPQTIRKYKGIFVIHSDGGR